MFIAIGSDHAGFDYKERLLLYLIECGHVVEDFGTHSEAAVDYPRFIRPVAEAVAAEQFERGIVLGGSGQGEAIVANRVPGIRCALCWNRQSARLAREHNDANMLSLGQRLLDFDDARAIVDCWLETPFLKGRHLRRIRLIDQVHGASRSDEHNGPLPHRTELLEEARLVCNSCGEEFLFPIDLSTDTTQAVVETCPVCCHENEVFLHLDDDGVLTVSGDRHITG
jgi:ribose 5-phosphate isomerase B